MVKKGHIALAASMLVALSMILAACGGGGGTNPNTGNQPYSYTAPQQKGGTVIYSDWQFPTTTNPWFQSEVVGVEVQAALWGSPVVISSDAKFLPDELTEVPTTQNGDVSADGLTVTMKLRHDLKWSDGQPITADDFIYWWNTLMDPATAAASTTGYDQIASMTAKDAYTLVLKYKQVFAPYLTYLPNAAPKHAWSSIADKDLANTPDVSLTPKVTSGPFKVSDYASGQSFTMVPNPNYTSTTLHPSVLDKVIFKTYQSKDSLIAGYQAGETDHAEDFTLADLQKVNGLPGLHIAPNIAYEHIDFNLQNPVLQDLNVRKGIEQGIDRCQIIQSVLNQPCNKMRVDTVLPQPDPDFDPTIDTFHFDLNAAKNDMKAAGWDCSSNPCTKGGQSFPTLNLVTTSGNTQRKNVTEIVKQELAALGVPVNLDGQYYPADTLFADFGHQGILATGKYDLALFAYVFGVDSDGNLYPSFHSSQIPSDADQSGGNYERVNNPQLDQLLEQGRTTIDQGKRSQIYKDAQKLVIQQVYTIPMYLRPNITLTNTKVQNYFDNPTSQGNQWNIGDWWVKAQ